MIIYYHCTGDNALLLLTCHPYIPFHFLYFHEMILHFTVHVVLNNPRRACAARVTVVGLRESWGAMFSTTGGKGKERGGKGKRGRREEGGQSAISGGKFKFCT